MSEFTFHTLRESITSAIREKILTGGLQPGCKLTEQKLAEEFGLQPRAHPGSTAPAGTGGPDRVFPQCGLLGQKDHH